MYSHYMDGVFAPLTHRPISQPQATQRSEPKQAAGASPSALLGDISGGISKLLGSITKQFSPERFDTGDILLILILLFLFLEGDNLELVITLGLMLFFSLTDGQ